MHILVTGCAGFIGFHLSLQLLEQGHTVTGIDNLNDYYDPQIKRDRLSIIQQQAAFQFQQIDLCDKEKLTPLFANNAFDCVVNLAAQAGVRYSLTHPQAYIDANIVGFLNILEACRHHHIKNLVFASSSSVYGANTNYPFSEENNVDHPISLYAASKKSNELMAHTYAHLFNLPCTGVRFFTVYGPWGRPDMALFKFTKNILQDLPIDVYNHGNMLRDFTYVDDIVGGLIHMVNQPAKPNPHWDGAHPDPATSNAPYRIYNIGRGAPISLMEFINIIETETGKKAKLHLLPMQPGDVPQTYANTSLLNKDFDYSPSVPPEKGVKEFVKWFKSYYKL